MAFAGSTAHSAYITAIQHRAKAGTLLVVLFVLTILSAAATLLATSESPLTQRIHRASVSHRLVLLGYERADAERAIAGFSQARLAQLASSLGRPTPGFFLLSALCLVFSVSAIWLILLVI